MNGIPRSSVAGRDIPATPATGPSGRIGPPHESYFFMSLYIFRISSVRAFDSGLSWTWVPVCRFGSEHPPTKMSPDADPRSQHDPITTRIPRMREPPSTPDVSGPPRRERDDPDDHFLV